MKVNRNLTLGTFLMLLVVNSLRAGVHHRWSRDMVLHRRRLPGDRAFSRRVMHDAPPPPESLRLTSRAGQEALPDARWPLHRAADGRGPGPLQAGALEARPIFRRGPARSGALQGVAAGVQRTGRADKFACSA